MSGHYFTNKCLKTIFQFKNLTQVIYRKFAMNIVNEDCHKVIELQLPLGRIKGVQRKTVYDEVYTAFEGLPYAKPPLGKLRFREPQPIDAWTETQDCTEFNTIPVQYDKGSEDCLYLNVYTKTLCSAKKLPVMVFLYGGGFRQGDCTRAHYGPDYFMFKDIVLVIPNYRVSALGFLSLKDPACQIPGNAGLKDQLMALKFIKKYIDCFNGDCHNITLMGESAGAVSTHLLMASKQSEGLFHKAIIMSASAYSLWGCLPADDVAYRLAKKRGYTGENNDKCVLEFLQLLRSHDLTMDQDLLLPHDLLAGRINAFAPTVEPYMSDTCIIDKSPLEMLQTSWSNKVPLMIGGTSFEGLVMYPFKDQLSNRLEELRKQTELLLPIEIKHVYTAEELVRMGKLLSDMHFGKGARENDAWLQLLDVSSSF